MSLGRLTLGAAKTRIAEAINVCSTDARVASYLNEATELLLPMGKWVGTVGRYRICTQNALVTMPREIETVESYAICRTPGTVRNGWYEFMGNGIGLAETDEYMGNTMIDRDEVCCHTDPAGDDQKLRLYAESSDDAGEEVVLLFKDENELKVRTAATGIEGETVTLVAPPNYALSTHYVYPGSLYGVIKPATVGCVRLYCYDTVALTQFEVGYYEPDELRPTYRRYMVPYLDSYGTCDDSTCDDADDQQITVRAKLRHRPVANDNDWLLIGNLPALCMAVQAVKEYKPGGDIAKGDAFLTRAVGMLQSELKSHQGNGQIVMPKFQGPATFGAGRIGFNHSSCCNSTRRC